MDYTETFDKNGIREKGVTKTLNLIYKNEIVRIRRQRDENSIKKSIYKYN